MMVETTNLPEPLTPADTDVRDLDGFMLNVERLMASELWALSTGEEFKAAVALWCRAWKQYPAGSLPNDDRVLAGFSGAGKRWKAVREMALRGFVLCSDGRLYHSTMSQDAVRASAKKVERRERTKAATEARQQQRGDQRHVKRDEPRDVQHNGSVTTSQGQGQGQGQGQERKKEAAAAAAPSEEPTFEAECRLLVEPEPIMLAQDFHAIEVLLGEGLTRDDVRAGIREALGKRSDPTKRYRHWSQLAGWCRTAAKNRLAAGPQAFPKLAGSTSNLGDPRVDLGGVVWPESSVRKALDRFRIDPRSWPDLIGEPPGQPFCRVPERLLVEFGFGQHPEPAHG